MAQKAVLKVDVHSQKQKVNAMKIVSGFPGMESVSMKDGKITATGEFDPVNLVDKLRKVAATRIESVVPVKDKKKGKYLSRRDESEDHLIVHVVDMHPPVNYCCHVSVEEDPNGCIIC